MKIISFGITDYKSLINENYYYVDKTMYLEKLENLSNKNIVYLKPRRFGKTLFTSMMYYYYDINSAYLYEDLFKNTYIYNHETKNKNNYYILKFDFSGMSSNENTRDDIEEKFNKVVKNSIIEFLKYYKLNCDIDFNERAADLLSSFIVNANLDHKIYVIIDEYDNFTNSILERNNVDLFKKILGKNGFVKDFYARIKSYTGTVIDRVFITGVCSISLDSMTSGFNIASNITVDFMFNSMTALTHEEVKKLINDLNINKKDEVFNEMKEFYDGYCFNDDVEELVFNPTLTMYYLSNLINKGVKPKKLLDSNIMSSYEQIKNIISLGDYKDILDDIYDNGEIEGTLKVNFDLNNNEIYKFDKSDIVSLLFYFGYLTIKEANEFIGYKFRIPNKVIKEVYSKYYMSILKEYNIYEQDEMENNAISDLYYEGNIVKLCDYVSFLLKQADNRIYINFVEKDLQIMVYALLSKYVQFDIYLEYPSNDNFIDLMIFGKNYNIMIELKYLSKKNKREFNAKLNDARSEIDKYLKDTRIKKDNLKKYIVIFIASEYYIEKVK